MERLTDEQLARRDELMTSMEKAWNEAQQRLADFNAGVEELRTPVDAALIIFNDVVNEANDFMSELRKDAAKRLSEMRKAGDDSEDGQARYEAYEKWADDFENDIDHLGVDIPDEADFDADPAEMVDAMQSISAAPEGWPQ
jgi:chromosome segregation ATPase